MRYQHDGGLLHPVLGQGDDHYPGCRFSADMRYRLDKTPDGEIWASFEANFSCDVDAIRDLVTKARAVCAVWVYCGATSYRNMERAPKGKLGLQWRIRRDELNGLVDSTLASTRWIMCDSLQIRRTRCTVANPGWCQHGRR